MKKGLILTLILTATICSLSNAQFAFSVSPGFGINSAYFGYQANSKFVPYIGVQFLSAKFKVEESGQRYDSYLNQIVSYTESGELSGSLFIPTIGAKYFIMQQNKLQAYLSLNISKPLGSAKLENDGEEDEDFAEAIKNSSSIGGELGFGVEFFFDDNFSMGGEFGLRYARVKFVDTFDRQVFNPNTGNIQNVEIEDNLTFGATPTFTKITLNYYFSSQGKSGE